MNIQDFDRANEINSELIRLREYKAQVEKSNSVCFGYSSTLFSNAKSVELIDLNKIQSTGNGVRFNYFGEDERNELLFKSNSFQIAKKAFLDELEKAIVELETEFSKLGNE